MQRAEVAVQMPMKPSLQDCIPVIINQVKQRAEAYPLDVEGDIKSWQKALSRDVCKMCTKIAECLDTLRGDVWEWGEGSSMQHASRGI